MAVDIDCKSAYRKIRNYLGGRLVGATRDETLFEVAIDCLFCKIYIQQNEGELEGEDAETIGDRYCHALRELRGLLPERFGDRDKLKLDLESLVAVDKLLETAGLNNPIRDPIGDLYEVFMGANVRGQNGQFFTPQNAIEAIVSMVDPQPGETIVDPACGAGGFLSVTARYLKTAGATDDAIANCIFGVDKDRELAAIAAARLSLSFLKKTNVFCGDSLAWMAKLSSDFTLNDKKEKFDIVLTNPPFGARIVATSPEVRSEFELGYRWRWDSCDRTFKKLPQLQTAVAPQVLFIERCLSLVRPGGRIGMVVPESLISSKTYRYVVQYIRNHAKIMAIVGMPECLFKSSGKGGTHTKTCLLLLRKRREADAKEPSVAIFMAEAKWCGHDSRGRQIERDDLPAIALSYRDYRDGRLTEQTEWGYCIGAERIEEDILAPHYYNPEATAELWELDKTHDLVKLGDLIATGAIEVKTGDEVGKLAYGGGTIPFIRTSDLSNWEIKVDPKHCVSDEIYQALSAKQDVREGDILMVRDGTYLIGTCALVTKYDTRIVYQSHIYKLRVKDPGKISPYLLLAALSSTPVQKQILAKRLSQDIIQSLGSRIDKLVLPIPQEKSRREEVTQMVKQAIQQRIEARELARRACVELVKRSQSKP